MIALCHLPIRFGLRAAAIGVAAVALGLSRLQFDRPFWAVLGSMFMFRMIISLYELRRESKNAPLALTLAYFFPLPNVCSILFPILDFKAFRETYQPDAALATAQKGVKWIVRGLSHILAHRIVKYYVLPHPVLFLAAN